MQNERAFFLDKAVLLKERGEIPACKEVIFEGCQLGSKLYRLGVGGWTKYQHVVMEIFPF